MFGRSKPLTKMRPSVSRSRGGERDPRHVGEALVQHRQLPILRPEVVPPLRHAMGLVDGEQCRRAVPQMREERVGEQPFRRHVDQVQLAGAHLSLDPGRLGAGDAGVQRRGAHAELPERRHLVLHQRDQRRHHDGDARPAQGRDLVAQRLAATGRHQHQRVTAGDQVADDLRLLAAEAIEPEDAAQHLERITGHALGYTGCGGDRNRRAAEARAPG
jgi:hypothetical protein